MWTYERRLEYPVNITKTNAKLAKVIITQFGGPYCRKGEKNLGNYYHFFIKSVNCSTKKYLPE